MIGATSCQSTTQVAAKQPGILKQLYRDDVNLVSWRRELPSDLEEQLLEWTSSSPAEFNEILSMQSYDLSAAMRGLKEPARAWLTTDVRNLLTRFTDFTSSNHLRVSFGAVRTDQCRKFHVDSIRYRLLTTYMGPGTEWLPDDAVRREALGRASIHLEDPNKAIVRDPAAVRRAVAGEVIVMKGARHPNQRGAVHRSPPIECGAKVRVVLVATTVDQTRAPVS